jgi:Interferon-related developmental regulator (IFRD)
MGRKRASADKKGHGRGDDNDDARSTASHETNDSKISMQSGKHDYNTDDQYAEDDGSDVEKEPLTAALDKLSEKRGSTRVEGLGELLELLQSGSDLEAIQSKRSALLDSLLGCLRRPSTESEAELSARCLAALCVCLGPEEDALYRCVRVPCITAYCNSCTAAYLRTELLRCSCLSYVHIKH